MRPLVRLRRTWPQRLLIAGNLTLIALLVNGAAALGWFYWRFGQLPRLTFGTGVLDEAPGPAFNVLLVGSDSREFVANDRDAAAFGGGQVRGQRSDTILVVRVDPAARAARVLSIPRDLWVPIAGTGSPNRINAAIGGGPERLIATIRAALGVPIHHYVQVDFAGFREIVHMVGGVSVRVPGPARDVYSGLDLERGGCVELSGDQALAYVRSRHFQYFDGRTWRFDPTGDFGRIERQQHFIRQMLHDAVRSAGVNPLRLDRLLQAGIRNVRVDDQLSFNDLVQLARRFRSLDPAAVEMHTLPSHPARVGERSVVLLDEDSAAPVLARFRGVRPRPPAERSPASTAPRAAERDLPSPTTSKPHEGSAPC